MASTLSTDNIRGATGTSINITGAALNSSSFTSAIFESANVVAAAGSGTINVDLLDKSIMYYTSNATSNATINFRGNVNNTLNTTLAVGQVATSIIMLTQGATAYLANVYQIDGSTVTPRWQSGSAPTAGSANSIDIVSVTIVKTASTPTYTMLASQTQFK